MVGNLLDKYSTGTLDAQDCVGVCGKLKLKIKPSKDDYPAKNEIADFIVQKEKPAEDPVLEEETNDDVPF